MKRFIIILSILFFGNLLVQKTSTASGTASYETGGNFGFFYSSLSPHGEWIDFESGLHVWRPHHMSRDWRPYLFGRWVWTDYGWYWMSNEPFGWITYHYGRWYCDDYYGWIWVPDNTWGPAWVEWRYDNDYVGWAPLPPYATFSVSVGIRFTNRWAAPVHYWNFVRYRHFGRSFQYRDFEPENHVRRLIGTTRSGYKYETNNDHIINRGVDRTFIEQRGRMHIPSVVVEERNGQSGERLIRSNNNKSIERIEIHRPTQDEMQRNVEHINVRRGERTLSIDINKIERQRTDSRVTPDNRTPGEIRRESSLQQRQERKIERQERIRGPRPRIREQRQQPNKQEMRRELIQRHENKRNPSPPIRQEPLRKIERQRQSHSGSSSIRSIPESRSERNKERR